METPLTLVGVMPKKKQPLTEFGARLMALRQEKGLTQVQLAQAAGTTQRVLSRLETTAPYPTVPILVALAKALGVSADELLGLKPPPRSVASRRPLRSLDKRLLRQLEEVSSLPERDRRALLRLMRTAAKSTARPQAPPAARRRGQG